MSNDERVEQETSSHNGEEAENASAGNDANGYEEQGYGGIVLDDEISHLIRRAHQRASATFMSVLSDQRLTPAQYFALARLREKGRVSQNLLGRMSAMDPATIQGVVKRLGERGFIRRLHDPKDRRRMILELTPAGRSLVDNLQNGMNAVTDQILGPLAPNERDQLRHLLKRIV